MSEIVVNLALVGPHQSGKSSVLNRLTHQVFVPDTMPTLGTGFRQHSLHDGGDSYLMNIWDTAGKADMYDYTNEESWTETEALSKEVRLAAGDAPVILAGNKTDLGYSRAVEKAIVTKHAKKQGMRYAECSAKSGDGVVELMKLACSLSHGTPAS